MPLHTVATPLNISQLKRGVSGRNATSDNINAMLPPLTQNAVGASLYGNPATEAAALSAIGATVVNQQYPLFYVDRYLTNTGTTDMEPAFNASWAVAVALGGGRIRYGATAPYNTGSPINWTSAGAPSLPGISCICEAGPALTIGSPSLIANHNGHVFDLCGSYGVKFENVTGTNGASSVPQTMFFMARNSGGTSVQSFRFYDCGGAGKFSKALLYNYASEDDQITGGEWTNTYSAGAASTACWTATNILGLTSTFQTVFTGSESCTDHKVVGGEWDMDSANAAADSWLMDNIARFDAFGFWIDCSDGATGGGRSLINMNPGCSDICLYGVKGEPVSAALNPMWPIYFSGSSGSPVRIRIDGAYLPAQTGGAPIYAGAGVIPDGCHFTQVADLGIPAQIVDKLLASSIDCDTLQWVIGTSANNALTVYSERVTITTRSNDNIQDMGTANKIWTPALGTITASGALTYFGTCEYRGAYLDFEGAITCSGIITCTAGQTFTGLPSQWNATQNGYCTIIDSTTGLQIATGTVLAGGIAIACSPFTTTSGHGIIIQGGRVKLA
jgi:hypothetical protein